MISRSTGRTLVPASASTVPPTPGLVLGNSRIAILPGNTLVGAEAVTDAESELGIAARGRHGVANVAIQPAGQYDGLEILLQAFGGEQEGGRLAVQHRTSEHAFINAALLGRADDGESVARVEMRVAEREIDRAVVFRSGGFGDDLEASFAGTREFGRIRILIDADLLNCGRSDAKR